MKKLAAGVIVGLLVGIVIGLQFDTNTTLSYLRLFSEAGKQLIVIDYPTDEPLILDFCEKARELGYLPYPGGRELDDIRHCPSK